MSRSPSDRPRPEAVRGTAVETTGGNGLTRVTVNLNRQAAEALEAVSEATGRSKTDVINRSLAAFAVIQDLLDRNGGSFVVTHKNGDKERITIL
jgi:hypothetical protein